MVSWSIILWAMGFGALTGIAMIIHDPDGMAGREKKGGKRRGRR